LIIDFILILSSFEHLANDVGKGRASGLALGKSTLKRESIRIKA